MTDEPRYTLDEARRELARRECGYHGHDYETTVRPNHEPVTFFCNRCGKTWGATRLGLGTFIGQVEHVSIPPESFWMVIILDKNGDRTGNAGPRHPTQEAAQQWLKEVTI